MKQWIDRSIPASSVPGGVSKLELLGSSENIGMSSTHRIAKIMERALNVTSRRSLPNFLD